MSNIQDIAADPAVVFETTAVTPELHDSQGIPITEGLQWHYRAGYSGAWQPVNSPVELLPISNLNVRVTYGAADETQSKIQDITTDPAVVFETIRVTLTLLDCSGKPVTGADFTYRVGSSGAWQPVSTPVDLLPISNLNVRVSWDTLSESQIQDITHTPQVVFQPAATCLTVIKTGNGFGSVIVNGQVCDVACQQLHVPFTEQTVVNLEAIPEPGSYFVRWEDESGQPLDGIVYEATDVTVYAVFGISE
ncbi:MAG: hypothetical protein GY792_25870, partial [Gammaproteobacteria bacterium]|nr:hypothetical protein [Gammaproteobacteria bacterium]